ncbi:hypothetical protein Cgig2_001450 [Carnegiea gigantea]|uniref:Pyrroline-5-carboxylate reductase dimerisation domain-containing protein n=1 Tax=Carnegiea gigantea TaxID=171969 RepID=A0A9Q1KU91_9CARY|nr:hypothetical protein Cgig2_001450 [Carnegiea gigantea]
MGRSLGEDEFEELRWVVISLGGAATEEDGELIETLFGAIGEVWRTDEKLFDAIAGLRPPLKCYVLEMCSRSGPVCTSLAMEALADGGVAAGVPRDLAMGIASQTILGAASMAVESGKRPAHLKDEIAGAGGISIAGIHELEKGGLRGTLMNAVVAAAKHTQYLFQSQLH